MKETYHVRVGITSKQLLPSPSSFGPLPSSRVAPDTELAADTMPSVAVASSHLITSTSLNFVAPFKLSLIRPLRHCTLGGNFSQNPFVYEIFAAAAMAMTLGRLLCQSHAPPLLLRA